eukprot:scaffold10353_cov60-Phaeocystis_antarctica.AAC.2
MEVGLTDLRAGLTPRDGRRGHRVPHDLDVLLQHARPSLNVVLQAYPWRRCLQEPSLLLHELLRRHTRGVGHELALG